MEDKRAQTYARPYFLSPSHCRLTESIRSLQALSTFIDKQRALLTRTHADIDRLNELRNRAVARPEGLRDNVTEEVRLCH